MKKEETVSSTDKELERLLVESAGYHSIIMNSGQILDDRIYESARAKRGAALKLVMEKHRAFLELFLKSGIVSMLYYEMGDDGHSKGSVSFTPNEVWFDEDNNRMDIVSYDYDSVSMPGPKFGSDRVSKVKKKSAKKKGRAKAKKK